MRYFWFYEEKYIIYNFIEIETRFFGRLKVTIKSKLKIVSPFVSTHFVIFIHGKMFEFFIGSSESVFFGFRFQGWAQAWIPFTNTCSSRTSSSKRKRI